MMTPEPPFSFQHTGKHLRVQFSIPQVDNSLVGRFQDELQEVWSEEIDSITIDLRTVEYIDSSGVGALLSIRKRLGEGSDPIVLTEVTAEVGETLRLLHLQRVFTIEPATPEA